MSIETWSDEIYLVAVDSEPGISEDMGALVERLAETPRHVVVNLEHITHLNSSNIAQLLRLRKKLIEVGRKLRLCCVNDQVWTVMLVTGLDQVFEFAQDVPSALTGLQMDRSA